MSEEIDPRDPYIMAWKEQFASLLRDKILQMMEALKVTGWTTIAHVFNDPYDDGDVFRLVYEKGEFFVANLSDPTESVMKVDLKALGIRT